MNETHDEPVAAPAEDRCPFCSSANISPSEKEYGTDYPFWTVFLAVGLLFGVFLALFIFLHLHPVIMVLILVAAVSKLLDSRKRRPERPERIPYICLDCERRFEHKAVKDI